VIVVQLPEDEEEPEAGKVYALVNPEIVTTSEERVVCDEGCHRCRGSSARWSASTPSC